MRILYLLLFSFLACQCENDIELIEKEDEKISIENIESANLNDQDIPTNWPWRGISIPPSNTTVVNEHTIKELKTQGIDAIRLRIGVKRFCIQNNVSIEVGMEQHLQWIEKVIQWCANEDIIVILNSNDFPLDPLKNFNNRSPEFWDSESELNAAINYINKLVLKFDKYANVVAYDFFSEPVYNTANGPIRPENWFSFFNRLLDTIRMHSNKYVVFTPGPGGLPRGYSDFKEPIDDDKIIYGFHFYVPHKYTHQGIGDRPMGTKYPGLIGLTYWDSVAIHNEISAVVNWAKEHNKLVYVGEFSAVRWAEGKEQYLEDVLEVFEVNEIAYTYWGGLSEWIGWHMDYEPKENGSKELIKSPDKTRTRQILENFWSKNN